MFFPRYTPPEKTIALVFRLRAKNAARLLADGKRETTHGRSSFSVSYRVSQGSGHADGQGRGPGGDGGQGCVHGLLVFGQGVCHFLAVLYKDQAVIGKGGSAAAHAAIDLLDADEDPLQLVVGQKADLEPVPEVDPQSAHLHLVKLLRRFKIRVDRRAAHRSAETRKALFRHEGHLLFLCPDYKQKRLASKENSF